MLTVHIGKKIGSGEPTFIIAEIGINHNGDIELAKKLIDAAVNCGCDAVKFQKRTVPIVYTREELAKQRDVPREVLERAVARKVLPKENVERLLKSDYTETTNGDLKWALEFSENEYRTIDAYCKEKGILWFASPWDEDSVDFLETFDPACYKIASASMTDDGLLRHVRKTGRPIVMSTGMSNMDEIEHAVSVVGTKDLVLMHTRSTYPAAIEELNLRGIQALQQRFPDIPIGYSGHEVGLYTTLGAVALGACVVERHLTLDRSMWGSDQAASVEVGGMERLVKDICVFEKSLGNGVLRRFESEEPVRKKLRRKG